MFLPDWMLGARICFFRIECWEQGYVSPGLNAGSKDMFLPDWIRICFSRIECWEQGYVSSGLNAGSKDMFLTDWMLGARICFSRIECWEQGYVSSGLNTGSKDMLLRDWMLGARICFFRIECWEQGYVSSGLNAGSKDEFTANVHTEVFHQLLNLYQGVLIIWFFPSIDRKVKYDLCGLYVKLNKCKRLKELSMEKD